jgi:CIC family chloride channel protein
MGANDAAKVFEVASADALVVVSDLAERKVIGSLTEAHLFRRYTEELEKVRADLSG